MVRNLFLFSVLFLLGVFFLESEGYIQITDSGRSKFRSEMARLKQKSGETLKEVIRFALKKGMELSQEEGDPPPPSGNEDF